MGCAPCSQTSLWSLLFSSPSAGLSPPPVIQHPQWSPAGLSHLPWGPAGTHGGSQPKLHGDLWEAEKRSQVPGAVSPSPRRSVDPVRARGLTKSSGTQLSPLKFRLGREIVLFSQRTLSMRKFLLPLSPMPPRLPPANPIPMMTYVSGHSQASLRHQFYSQKWVRWSYLFPSHTLWEVGENQDGGVWRTPGGLSGKGTTSFFNWSAVDLHW